MKDWKRRWLVLAGNSLLMFRDEISAAAGEERERKENGEG
jgi:hypothetical protein